MEFKKQVLVTGVMKLNCRTSTYLLFIASVTTNGNRLQCIYAVSPTLSYVRALLFI